MGDNERNASDPVDEQETNEAEGNERPAVRLRRPDEERPLSAPAPADDEIIIK